MANALSGRVPIELDQTRHVKFSLALLDELEEEIGDIGNLGERMEGKGRFKFIIWLMTKALNAGADVSEEPLTSDQVGNLLHMGNMSEVTNAIRNAFTMATTGELAPDPTAGDNPN